MRLYLDSAYIAKCYLREVGTDAVLDLVESSASRVSSELALVEVSAVFHRHFREGKLTRDEFENVTEQFMKEDAEEIWDWIPTSDSLLREAVSAYRQMPPDTFLRSADCIHLVSARRVGLTEVYSNDRRLLDACPQFGLRGVDVIG